MEPGAKVKLRGVQVGRVAASTAATNHAALKLEIDSRSGPVHPGQRGGTDPRHDGVRRQVRRPDLSRRPRAQHISAAGAVLESQQRQHRGQHGLRKPGRLLNQIDAGQAERGADRGRRAVRGRGERIGEATTDANQVLAALNPRSGDGAARLALVEGASATPTAPPPTTFWHLWTRPAPPALRSPAKQQTWMPCCSTRSGSPKPESTCSRPTGTTWSRAVNTLEPTTNLLLKYNPVYTCMLWARSGGWTTAAIGDGRRRRPANDHPTSRCCSATTRTAIPTICRSWRPRAARAANRAAVRCRTPPRTSRCASWSPTPAGAPALDIRPNPGIGQPWWVDFFPVTRAVPEPPSIRDSCRPAIGPVPARGAALRGAAVRPRRGAAVAGNSTGRTPPPGRCPARPRTAGGLRRPPQPAPTGSQGRDADRSSGARTMTDASKERRSESQLAGAVWRLAIFVVACLLGIFALLAIFAQLRFEKENVYRRSSPTSPG